MFENLTLGDISMNDYTSSFRLLESCAYPMTKEMKVDKFIKV